MVRWKSVAVVTLLCVAAERAAAEADFDREPPMTWVEALACERVVVAAYEGGEAASLRLRVDRVLRGAGVRPGDVLTVALEHRYRLEPRAAAVRPQIEKGSASPWLCYLEQFESPGPIDPRPVLASARSPAVYFLPSAEAPALRRRGQVQPGWLADGWARVLRGQKADLLWRLRQTTDARVANAALEELAVSREPTVIDALFARLSWTQRRPWPESWEVPFGLRWLQAIGDRGGDVYDRALRLLDEPPGDENLEALATLCADADPVRAEADLLARLAPDRPAQLRTAAAIGLGRAGTPAAVEAMLRILEETPTPSQPFPPLAHAADRSLRASLRFRGEWDPHRTAGEVARLRRTAWQRLRAIPQTTWTSVVLNSLLNGLREEMEPTQRPEAAQVAAALAPASDPRLDYAGEERSRTRKAALENPAPEFVPAIVDALLVGDASSRGGSSYYVREIVRRHARICRRAMRSACESRGLLGAQRSSLGGLDPADLREWLRDGPPRWPSEPIPEDLEALAGRIRQGEKELVPKLLECVRERLSSIDDTPSSVGSATAALLASGDPAALAEYLRIVDATPRLVPGRFRDFTNGSCEVLLAALFAVHPREFAVRVADMLGSLDPFVREAGAALVRRYLSWEPASYNWTGFIAERRAPLVERARAMLARVAAASDEAGARANVLRSLGVKLEGAPAVAWIPVLRAAAADDDPAVAENAVRLLGLVLGERDVADEVLSMRPADRPSAVAEWLKDRGH